MRIRFPHAFSCLATVLAIQFIAIYLHWYAYQPDFDIPMHFAGGFSVALLAIAVQYEYLRLRHQEKTVWWHEFIFVLGFVALVAVGWEFFEFLLDTFWGRSNGFISQISIQDTMGDLAMGLLGGATSYLLFRPGRLTNQSTSKSQKS